MTDAVTSLTTDDAVEDWLDVLREQLCVVDRRQREVTGEVPDQIAVALFQEARRDGQREIHDRLTLVVLTDTHTHKSC